VFFLLLLVDPLFFCLFSCVADVVATFRTVSSNRFHWSYKLSDSGSSSLWYFVATFPSFNRSTVNRLSCCDVVLLARLIRYLNFVIISMWSESMFAPLHASYFRVQICPLEYLGAHAFLKDGVLGTLVCFIVLQSISQKLDVRTQDLDFLSEI
jgi:hypothetical protein